MLATALDTLVTYNPWTLSPATTLAEAARLLDETGISAWPVVDDDGSLVGSLTACAVDQALLRHPTGQESIAAIVARDAAAMTLATCPLDALTQMLDAGRRVAPVIEADRVVGTLSTTDFLRELSYGSSRAGREVVIDYLDKSAETLDSDATLQQAYDTIVKSAKSIVIVQGDFPLGALSGAAVSFARVQQFARRQRGAANAERTVGQLLQSTPTVAPGRSLAEAANLMVEHQLDALAVANQSAHLLGVLTEEHILRALLEYER